MESKRLMINRKTLTVTMPFNIEESARLNAYLAREGKKKGFVVREAIIEYLDRKERSEDEDSTDAS